MVDFAIVGSFYIILINHIYLDLVTRMVRYWCSCTVHSSVRPIWVFWGHQLVTSRISPALAEKSFASHSAASTYHEVLDHVYKWLFHSNSSVQVAFGVWKNVVYRGYTMGIPWVYPSVMVISWDNENSSIWYGGFPPVSDEAVLMTPPGSPCRVGPRGGGSGLTLW